MAVVNLTLNTPFVVACFEPRICFLPITAKPGEVSVLLSWVKFVLSKSGMLTDFTLVILDALQSRRLEPGPQPTWNLAVQCGNIPTSPRTGTPRSLQRQLQQSQITIQGLEYRS